MLSRVADALYWMSRYMERAEDITRVLTVNFNALLDMPLQDSVASWRALIQVTGATSQYEALFDTYTAENAMTFLLWDERNLSSVMACINLARENARTVREQISSEMWEQINGVYYRIKDADRAAALRGPTELFGNVRDGSHAFQGVTHATMTHGDGFHFIQIGKHLERAETTARILDVRYGELISVEESSPLQTILLSVMLRSCSAMEAYRKQTKTLLPVGAAEFLLLNNAFPRSVVFCLNSVLDGLRRISGAEVIEGRGGQLDNAAMRSAGRLSSELTYLDLSDTLQRGLHPFLARQLEGMHALGDDITRTFFSAQVVLPGWRTYMQQVQQQQQGIAYKRLD
jgi:uncharacterized alpha-E superfamily protein